MIELLVELTWILFVDLDILSVTKPAILEAWLAAVSGY